jgi:hypothetical protein
MAGASSPRPSRAAGSGRHGGTLTNIEVKLSNISQLAFLA